MVLHDSGFCYLFHLFGLNVQGACRQDTLGAGSCVDGTTCVACISLGVVLLQHGAAQAWGTSLRHWLSLSLCLRPWDSSPFTATSSFSLLSAPLPNAAQTRT